MTGQADNPRIKLARAYRELDKPAPGDRTEAAIAAARAGVTARQLANAYGELDRSRIPALAVKAGVSSRQIGNLLSGRPISVNAFLRMCVVAGHDPAPDLPGPEGPHRPDDLRLERFAMALKMMRGMNRHNERDAAAAMKLSKSTVCRVENCQQFSLGVFLKVCRYINSHPFGWMRSTPPQSVPVDVSCGTSAAGTNKYQTKSIASLSVGASA